MSVLEALSNKELRAKCMEYGMPNVPVTDSSRKILMRRLEAAMSGKPMTPAKTNRRETMHVSKPSEIASSTKIINSNNVINAENSTRTPAKERASRRTIAVSERHIDTTTTVSEPEYSDVSPDRGEEPIVIAKAKTPERPTLYPKLPTKEPSPKPQMLSKTGVVTTSYVLEQKTNSFNKMYAAPDDDLAEEDMGVGIAKKPVISINPLKTYAPLSESKVSTSNPVSSSLSSSTRYSSLGSSGTSYNYNMPSTYTTSSLATSNVRKTYVEPNTTSYNINTAAPNRYNQYADADLEYEDDEDEDDDDVVVVEDSPLGKDIETPYLSEFARRLETLKSKPLRHSVGPTKITSTQSGSLRDNAAYKRRTMGVYTGSSNIQPRRSFQDSQEDNSPLRQFIMSLEEKYHLKQTFAIISIFIIAIFIYVFFIQTV